MDSDEIDITVSHVHIKVVFVKTHLGCDRFPDQAMGGRGFHEFVHS